MKFSYYIQNLDLPDDGEMGTAVLSCQGHTACVIVYGDARKLTERVTKILKGLNCNELET